MKKALVVVFLCIVSIVCYASSNKINIKNGEITGTPIKWSESGEKISVRK